jgi:hypothetical protein
MTDLHGYLCAFTVKSYDILTENKLLYRLHIASRVQYMRSAYDEDKARVMCDKNWTVARARARVCSHIYTHYIYIYIYSAD